MTPSMAFEKAPGVLGMSNLSKRLGGLGANSNEALGLTALGLEDMGVSTANKEDRIEVNLGERIRFDEKGDKIPASAHRLLDGIGRVLAENPATTIVVRAHTDDQGDAAFNLALTQRRADAIRAYLIGRGVEGARIAAVGMGETAPIAGTKGRQQNRAERAKNRRVELTITPREIPETESGAADADADPDGSTAPGSDSRSDGESDAETSSANADGDPAASQGATQ